MVGRRRGRWCGLGRWGRSRWRCRRWRGCPRPAGSLFDPVVAPAQADQVGVGGAAGGQGRTWSRSRNPRGDRAPGERQRRSRGPDPLGHAWPRAGRRARSRRRGATAARGSVVVGHGACTVTVVVAQGVVVAPVNARSWAQRALERCPGEREHEHLAGPRMTREPRPATCRDTSTDSPCDRAGDPTQVVLAGGGADLGPAGSDTGQRSAGAPAGRCRRGVASGFGRDGQGQHGVDGGVAGDQVGQCLAAGPLDASSRPRRRRTGGPGRRSPPRPGRLARRGRALPAVHAGLVGPPAQPGRGRRGSARWHSRSGLIRPTPDGSAA